MIIPADNRGHGEGAPRGDAAVRSWVMAYDIGCPRRARRVRRALASRQLRAQYSVFEVRLSGREHEDLLAEVAALCALDEDRLATWASRRSQHVRVAPAGLLPRDAFGQALPGVGPQDVLCSGNCVVCHDVRDPARLRRVGRMLAAQGVALQRSVNWLRMDAATCVALLQRVRQACTADDSVLAYPVAHAGDIWQLQSHPGSVLPCGGRPFGSPGATS